MVHFFLAFFSPARYNIVRLMKGGSDTPTISLFGGIKITMFYDDHNPPHFHAEYAGNRALIDIQQAYVIGGRLPNRQLKFVLAWAEMHRDELMQN